MKFKKFLEKESFNFINKYINSEIEFTFTEFIEQYENVIKHFIDELNKLYTQYKLNYFFDKKKKFLFIYDEYGYYFFIIYGKKLIIFYNVELYPTASVHLLLDIVQIFTKYEIIIGTVYYYNETKNAFIINDLQHIEEERIEDIYNEIGFYTCEICGQLYPAEEMNFLSEANICQYCSGGDKFRVWS